MQLSKNIRRTIKAFLFIALTFVFITIFSFSFELDENATETMLTSYSERPDIDTVFVGNSAGEMMDADLYSSLTGSHAFNMCTPSQGLSVSLKNIKMAASHHRIKSAVMLITLDTVNSEDDAGIEHLYDRVVDSSSPFHMRLYYSIKRNIDESFSYSNINTERSVITWVPWEGENNLGLSDIKKVFRKRVLRLINHDRLGSGIAYDLNSVKYETAPGYLTDDDIDLLQADTDASDDLEAPPGMISADKLTELAKISSFCRDNDISLTVIITPHRSDYYSRYDGFYEDTALISTFLDDFVSKRGVMYYNTEDDGQLHQILPDDYFYDWEHVDDEHVKEATEYLTEVISTL
ncbi:MAG: hypothetical protein K6G58_00145 [Lachnospiraceae bacterium]|nr:hypothetical protein [Lachnospiraceae bacterium]